MRVFNSRYALFAMRGLTLLARFIFVIFIANKLSVAEVGFYGFIVASIFLSVYIVGYEYGKCSARQIIKCKTLSCQEEVVASLTIFGLMMFVVVVPAVYYVMAVNEIYQYISVLCFLVIIYGESYIAEHKKVLISLSHPLYSGVIDFIKSGLWVYLLIPLVLFGEIGIDLNIIFFIWSVFVAIGVALVFLKLRSFYKKEHIVRKPEFEQYREQIYSSTPFFLSGLSLLAIELSGRISLQLAGFQIEAGVYTFYAGFIFAIPLFVWSASVAPDHAKILTTFEKHGAKESNKLIVNMTKKSLKICFVLSALLFFGFENLLAVVNKNEYLDYIDSFTLFLLAPFVHILDSHIYYVLYVKGMDKEIAISSVVGFLCLLVFQIFTLSTLGIVSVILSIIVALLISVLMKLFFIFRNKFDKREVNVI